MEPSGIFDKKSVSTPKVVLKEAGLLAHANKIKMVCIVKNTFGFSILLFTAFNVDNKSYS